jgi:hypothetical protein
VRLELCHRNNLNQPTHTPASDATPTTIRACARMYVTATRVPLRRKTDEEAIVALGPDQ